MNDSHLTETSDENSLSSSNNIINSKKFVEPTKKIRNEGDVRQFHGSMAYKTLITWIKALNKSVENKSNSSECQLSENVKNLLSVFDILDHWIDETPPIEGSMRFGNTAFRTWHNKLLEGCEELHKKILIDEKLYSAICELCPYLLDSFGNPQRIDYGTGHELHFVIWLYCLFALGVFGETDLTALVIKVFVRYLKTVRKLQQVYGQEPAGSRGVWCLDDYQFIPFIWGAAQLLDHPSIKPNSILDTTLVEKEADDYMYLSCIHYIHTVKHGPFFEHSPDLYNISGAQSWDKINKGMLRKYHDDVLSKYPVLQHMLFGSIFHYP